MSRRRPSSPARIAPAALAALVVLCLAPRATEAGCSSLVHTGGRPGFLALPALSELDGDASAITPDAPAPGRIPPCSGPSCSNGPGVPLAPTLLAPDLWRELWCNAGAAVRRDDSGRPLDFPEGPPASPSHDPTSVERPPRSHSA